MTLPRYTGVTVQTTTNAPAPAATVTVNLHNTSTPADLFSDENGATPLANPLTSDAVTGLFTFCVANGLYDITVTGVALTPYTIPGVQLVYQGAPVGQILSASSTLTHAEILALPTTPLSIIPAPGAGQVILPLSGWVVPTLVAPYTNIDPGAFLTFGHNTSTGFAFSFIPNDVNIINGSTTRLTDLLGTTTAYRQYLVPWCDTEGVDKWGPLTERGLSTDVDNLPFMLSISNGGLGNLTGGDPANTLRVAAYYLLQPTT